MSKVPTFHTVTLTSSATEYNLLTLLQAVDSFFNTKLGNRCLHLQLQFDPAAGGDILYIGNPGVQASGDVGVQLLAGQAWTVPSTQSNLIMLGDIAFYSNGASHKVLVCLVAR